MKKYLFILLLFNALQICYGQIVVPKTPQITNLEKQNPVFQPSKQQVQVSQFPIKKELSSEEKKGSFSRIASRN